MGKASEKLKAKYGREPTDSELAAYKAKRAAKKEKKKQTQPPPATQPPPKPRPPPTPQLAAVASSSEGVSDPFATLLGGPFAALGDAAATSKGRRGKPDREAFLKLWNAHGSVAQAFLANAKAALARIPEKRMTAAQRATYVTKIQKRLTLALRDGNELFDECMQRRETRLQKLRDAKIAKGGVSATPKAPKEKGPKRDDVKLEEAYDILKKFSYDIWAACNKNGPGYLSVQQMTQLALDKQVYESSASSKNGLLRALTVPGLFEDAMNAGSTQMPARAGPADDDSDDSES